MNTGLDHKGERAGLVANQGCFVPGDRMSSTPCHGWPRTQASPAFAFEHNCVFSRGTMSRKPEMWKAKGFTRLHEGIYWDTRQENSGHRGRSVEGSDLVGQGLRNLSQGGLTGAKVTPNQHGTLRPLLADELTTSKDSTSQENLFRTTINRNPNSNSEAKF